VQQILNSNEGVVWRDNSWRVITVWVITPDTPVQISKIEKNVQIWGRLGQNIVTVNMQLIMI
jgi:hypothetical protein